MEGETEKENDDDDGGLYLHSLVSVHHYFYRLVNCKRLYFFSKKKLSKTVEIVKNCKKCQNVGHVMFLHHSDQMAQRSQVSTVALWVFSNGLVF